MEKEEEEEEEGRKRRKGRRRPRAAAACSRASELSSAARDPIDVGAQNGAPGGALRGARVQWRRDGELQTVAPFGERKVRTPTSSMLANGEAR